MWTPGDETDKESLRSTDKWQSSIFDRGLSIRSRSGGPNYVV